MLLDLFEFETDAGNLDGGGGAPEIQEPVETVAETAAADTPTGWSADDPAFLSAVDQRAAEIAAQLVDSRIANLQPAQQQTQASGTPIDWNEHLSPLNDNFGQNFINLLVQRDQMLKAEYEKGIEPLLTREQQAKEAANEAELDKAISVGWNTTADGALSGEALKAIRGLARANYPVMAQQYGDSDFTASRALAQATETIRALNKQARGNGAAANQAELATLASANTAPGNGTQALPGNGPAETVEEALERFKAHASQRTAA